MKDLITFLLLFSVTCFSTTCFSQDLNYNPRVGQSCIPIQEVFSFTVEDSNGVGVYQADAISVSYSEEGTILIRGIKNHRVVYSGFFNPFVTTLHNGYILKNPRLNTTIVLPETIDSRELFYYCTSLN